MFGQVIPRSFVWSVSIWAVLTIGIIGCGDDGDDWVGTWSLETVDGESVEQGLQEEEEGVNISIVTNNWMFDNDGTLEVEMDFKVTEEGGGSELVLTVSNKITGTYSLSGSNYTLTMKGTLFFEEAEEVNTGTWSREGSTLTLNSDDGSTIVFKKK